MASTLMKKVLLQITNQEDLQLSTHRNRRVLSGVDLLLRIVKEGSEEHGEVQAVNQFSLSLLENLKAIVNGAIQSGKMQRQNIYQSYHAYVTNSLLAAWGKLEEQLQQSFDASLPQIIADDYLRHAMKEATEAMPSPPSGSQIARQLTDIEEQAIMYAAGYVVRVLLEKYKKRKDSAAANCVDCLTNMLEGSPLDIERDESFEECVARWVKLTSRGGLLILRQGAYWLFSEIEELLWPFLEKLSSSKACLDKEAAMKSILDADSIQFKWSMMDVDLPDPGQSQQLLTDIVEKWVTIRGFSYASKILEAYKVAKGCTLAKAKALRKDLQASGNKQ